MKKSIFLIFIIVVFLTSCGRAQGENSDFEETIATEQSSKEEKENMYEKETLESEGVTEGAGVTEAADATTDTEEVTDMAASADTTEAADTAESVSQVKVMQILIADNFLDEWSQSETGMWDESVIKLCSTSWQTNTLGKESKEEYPELGERLDEINEANQVTFQSFMEQQAPMAQEHYTDVPEYFNEYSSNSSYSVQRADSLVLSIREDGNEYTGGAHGMYGIWGINYEPSTGEELKLSDVCTKVEELPALLSEKIIADYADEYETFESLQGILEEYKPEDYNWTMNYQGITFYFSPYEIASYAMGAMKVTLWFDENPELFNEKFFEKPSTGYVMELPLNHEVDIDLDGGKKDKLTVSTYYKTQEDEEYDVRRLMITLNDVSYCEETYYGYDFYSCLVCAEDSGEEQYFLYVQGTAENDYSTIFIYDLNSEEIKVSDCLSGVGFCGVWDENAGEYGTYYHSVFSNPREVELGTRMEILGTWTGKRCYSIDTKNGIPKPMTEYFSISGSLRPSVSQIPLEVIMLPDEAREELPAGTEFYFIRTDGESYVDARLSDGRECRIMVEFKDYMQFVNGVDQWDCFDNLLYAG